ncbi:hypothetical protein QAD02_024062, partial [Eretmocerus hayati]
YHELSEWTTVCELLHKFEKCNEEFQKLVIQSMESGIPQCAAEFPGPSDPPVGERFQNWNSLCIMVKDLLVFEKQLANILRDPLYTYQFRHLLQENECRAGPSNTQGNEPLSSSIRRILSEISMFKQRFRIFFVLVLGSQRDRSVVMPSCQEE